MIKYILIAAIIWGGYSYWKEHSSEAATNKYILATKSENGFVALPQPSGTSARQVLIFAPQNCSSAEARRADEIAAQLARHNIPYARLDNANFDSIQDEADFKRLDAVMRGSVPIVFIGGRGKANPAPQDVVAEYRAMRRSL